MQFSVSRLGVFWTFFQPFGQVVAFILIKVLLFGNIGGAYDYTVFLALSFTAFNMFNGILHKSIGAFEANSALFNYRQVKPIDTIIARTLVEIFTTGVIYSIFISIGYYFGFGMDAKNIFMVGVFLTWFILFSFALGLVVAIGDTFYKSIGKSVRVLTFGLMIFSAVFYPLSLVPREIQSILLYNPLVHFMEMIRGFYFDALDDRFVDYGYVGMWTITLWYVGMWLYLRLEEKIVSQ